jgi:hypothetical protein
VPGPVLGPVPDPALASDSGLEFEPALALGVVLVDLHYPRSEAQLFPRQVDERTRGLEALSSTETSSGED